MPFEVWTAVDCVGPVGVFGSQAQAKQALEPYLKAHWSGMLVRSHAAPVGDGEDVYFLMVPGSPVPLFVGGAAEAKERQAALAPSGLVESGEELEGRVACFGKILPPAERRLGPLLRAKNPGGHGDSAPVQRFLELLNAQALPEEPSKEEMTRRFPVADFLVEVEPLVHCSISERAKAMANSASSSPPPASGSPPPSGSANAGDSDAGPDFSPPPTPAALSKATTSSSGGGEAEPSPSESESSPSESESSSSEDDGAA